MEGKRRPRTHAIDEAYSVEITKGQLLARLREEIRKFGTIKEFANRNQISKNQVSDTLLGKVEPSYAVCSAIGVKIYRVFRVKRA